MVPYLDLACLVLVVWPVVRPNNGARRGDTEAARCCFKPQVYRVVELAQGIVPTPQYEVRSTSLPVDPPPVQPSAVSHALHRNWGRAVAGGGGGCAEVRRRQSSMAERNPRQTSGIGYKLGTFCASTEGSSLFTVNRQLSGLGRNSAPSHVACPMEHFPLTHPPGKTNLTRAGTLSQK